MDVCSISECLIFPMFLWPSAAIHGQFAMAQAEPSLAAAQLVAALSLLMGRYSLVGNAWRRRRDDPLVMGFNGVLMGYMMVIH